MVRKALLVAAASAACGLPGAGETAPPPHYSKGKVAFSYLGDIWIANENGSGVQRLTDNKARDVYPRFSPDGNWIAFSSNRDGNYDVYVVPAAGGKPRQLTFHSADDNVVGWTPDGKKILFTLDARQGRVSRASPRCWRSRWRAASSGRCPPIGAPGPAIRRTERSWRSRGIPPSGRASIIAAAMRPTCG